MGEGGGGAQGEAREASVASGVNVGARRGPADRCASWWVPVASPEAASLGSLGTCPPLGSGGPAAVACEAASPLPLSQTPAFWPAP